MLQDKKLLFLAIFFMFSLACASTQEMADIDSSRLLLHVEYRSGGDTPIGSLISFLKDGRVRLYASRRSVSWSKISDVELGNMLSILESCEFAEDLADIRDSGYSFGCCDAEELGLFLEPQGVPTGIALDDTQPLPSSIKQLIIYIDRIGRNYFGRRYQPLLPEQ